MPFLKQRSDLILSNEEREILEKIEASRTEPYAKVIRARIMLRYSEGLAINAIALIFHGRADPPQSLRRIEHG